MQRDEVKILVDAVHRGLLNRHEAVAKEYLTWEERERLLKELFEKK